MELALHIRKLSDTASFESIAKRLNSFGNGADFSDSIRKNQGCFPARVYIGDEFCPVRLPGRTAIRQFTRFAAKHHIGITLLTPVLTEPWLEKYVPQFDLLTSECPEAEIVANDLGVLLYLARQYPGISLSMGRLFNKGFKDPRVPITDIPDSETAQSILSDCTFDRTEFQAMALNLGVRRFERDLMPYAKHFFAIPAPLSISCYFPFGYVTTGRVCWMSAFNRPSRKKFIPVKSCARPCDIFSMVLGHVSASFKLFQNGNTIFYHYTPAMLTTLLKGANTDPVRIVYQGESL